MENPTSSFNHLLREWTIQKFQIHERSSSINKELRGGLATFLTMSYILVVNPQLLASATNESSQTIVANTAIASAIGCLIVGFLGNMPFGLAPGIGLSTYLAYGLILNEGLSPTEAFTTCFLAGILLLLFSVIGLSHILMKLIPRSVKIATIVGMGLQIALVGLTSLNVVVANKQSLIGLGNVQDPLIWIGFCGLVFIGLLLFHQWKGSILIGITVLTLVTWSIQVSFPNEIVKVPDFASMDPSRYINFSGYSVGKCMSGLISFLFIGLIDVSGVIYGMASLANITREDGSIPGSGATFISVAVSTSISAILGGTPIIVYVESASGIKDGARTGLSAIVVGSCFLLAMFFAPLLSHIPVTATAPVSVLIGTMMMSQAKEIDWELMSDAIPGFLTLIIIPFTFSIADGIAAGLLSAFLFHSMNWLAGHMNEKVQSIYQEYFSVIPVSSSSHDLELPDIYDDLEIPTISMKAPTKEISDGSSNEDGDDKQDLEENSDDEPQSHPQHHPHQDFCLIRDVSRWGLEVDEPYVRSPDLVLPKSEAEAVKKAKGMSIRRTLRQLSSFFIASSADE